MIFYDEFIWKAQRVYVLVTTFDVVKRWWTEGEGAIEGEICKHWEERGEGGYDWDAKWRTINTFLKKEDDEL